MSSFIDPRQSSDDSALELHAWWLSRRGSGRRYPRWSEIDILELKAWLGWLVVYGLCADQQDAEYRLVGRKCVEAAGFDLTGEFVSNRCYTRSPEEVIRVIQQVCAFGGPCLQPDKVEIRETGYAELSNRLWMPFSEDDRVVDRILLYACQVQVVVPQDRRQETGSSRQAPAYQT